MIGLSLGQQPEEKDLGTAPTPDKDISLLSSTTYLKFGYLPVFYRRPKTYGSFIAKPWDYQYS